MDLLSLVAASIRRNIWGSADVDVPLSEGPLDYGSIRSDDHHDEEPEPSDEHHDEEPEPSDDHEEEPAPSEEDSSNAGELESGTDEPNNNAGQENDDDDEPSGRPKLVPRSWLTTAHYGKQQQRKRAKSHNNDGKSYLDIPFNDYAFYPGGAVFNVVRQRQKITAIILSHAEHLLLMRKTLKRDYVMQHIISQIPAGGCCRYDPKLKIFYAITEFEATTRIVQKLRDKRKRDDEAVPFRNYAFYPEGGQYDSIRNRQAITNLLMNHRIECSTETQLARHVRKVIMPQLFEKNVVDYQPSTKTFRFIDHKVATNRVLALMHGLPEITRPAAPHSAVSKRTLPTKRSRNSHSDAANQTKTKRQKMDQPTNIVAKVSEEADDGTDNDSAERTGKETEPKGDGTECLSEQLDEDSSIQVHEKQNAESDSEEADSTDNSESEKFSDDALVQLPTLLNMDRPDEVYERIVLVVNATKIPFHDCAIYPPDAHFDKIRPYQAITAFLNAHFDHMVKSTNAEQYVASRLVPALLDAGVCRYDAEAREFVLLSDEDVAEIILDPVHEMQQQLGMLSRVDTAARPAAAHPANITSVAEVARGARKVVAKAATPAQQQQKQKQPRSTKAKNQRTWLKDDLSCWKSNPAADVVPPPSRINLEVDPHREGLARKLSIQYNIPFHHCAFYPSGTSFNELRALQAITEFLSQHHDAMIRALKAKDYITKHIMPALMEVGVYEYDVSTKKFRLCEYREAEMKILQKVRDRKKYLRDSGLLHLVLEGA